MSRLAAAAALVVPFLLLIGTASFGGVEGRLNNNNNNNNKNAYAAMMYMGTPRDYEFYVATRVLMRSLSALSVDADLVLIASLDVPLPWLRALEEEDGVKVRRVKNLRNPYQEDSSSDRFKLTLNKLYAWSLVDYERVVMLDADNLFLQNTDELFQCGQFCAVFINPCIFHTGLFVLQPSMEVYNDMLHELESGRANPDGADQGFLGNYFSDLLDMALFHPPPNGTKLNGRFRLPLGYQMDASYYYLKLRWNIPCGPNSVITFPSAVHMKPWYWWSWPALPLGFAWHEQRRRTVGYGAEMPFVMIQATLYLGIIAVIRLTRPSLFKLCYKRPDRINSFYHSGLKFLAMFSILAAYVVPIFLIPGTVHPLVGWSLYLLGSFALCYIAINSFLLPMLAVLTPWLGFLGALLVMAFPMYHDGIQRALVVFGYAFCASPFAWIALVRVLACLQVSLEREAFLPSRLNEIPQPPSFSKLY